MPCMCPRSYAMNPSRTRYEPVSGMCGYKRRLVNFINQSLVGVDGFEPPIVHRKSVD